MDKMKPVFQALNKKLMQENLTLTIMVMSQNIMVYVPHKMLMLFMTKIRKSMKLLLVQENSLILTSTKSYGSTIMLQSKYEQTTSLKFMRILVLI